MDLTEIKTKSFSGLGNMVNFRQTPRLEQIIKPETDNIRLFRFKPRPHPPISRKKIISLGVSGKVR